MNDDRSGVNIHMNALEKIIGLRGGLSTLIPSLRIYIFWSALPSLPPPHQFAAHQPKVRHTNRCHLGYSAPLPPTNPINNPLPLDLEFATWRREKLSKALRCSFPSLEHLMDIFEDIVKYSLSIENEVFRKGAPVVKDFINGYFLLWYHLLEFQSQRMETKVSSFWNPSA